MTNPWEPDRPLSLDVAAEVIRESLPMIEHRGLSVLGSGWEFDALLTTDGWVVRFPRREEIATLFAKERPVHHLVARYLPESIAVPAVEHLGERSSRFPYPVAAHRFIGGIPVDEVAPALLPQLAREIGTILSALHGIPDRDARQAGVVRETTDYAADEGAQSWVEHGLDALSRRQNDAVVSASIEWVRRAPLSVAFEGPLRLIHQDLSPEHVLADPDTGRLTGILDWTDVTLGDPARDFVFLVGWRGWSFVEDVLRNYEPAVDDGFRDRLRFMARRLTPIWLGFACERGTDVEKMTSWVHNAFA